MNGSSIPRRLLSIVAVLLLLALAWWTVTGGLRDVPQSRTVGQWLETIIRLACGVLSVSTAVTRFWWRVFARRVRFAWTVTLAGFLGLTALVWGAPQPHVALLFVVVALLLAWAVVWALGPAGARSGSA